MKSKTWIQIANYWRQPITMRWFRSSFFNNFRWFQPHLKSQLWFWKIYYSSKSFAISKCWLTHSFMSQQLPHSAVGLIHGKGSEVKNAVVEIVARWTEFYGIPHHTSLIECISGVKECEAYRRATTKWRLAYGTELATAHRKFHPLLEPRRKRRRNTRHILINWFWFALESSMTWKERYDDDERKKKEKKESCCCCRGKK